MSRADRIAILRKAADHVLRVGLHKHWFWDNKWVDGKQLPPEECPVCLMGAVKFALLGSPAMKVDSGLDVRERYAALYSDICMQMDLRDLPEGVNGPVSFSDHPNTTAADVAALLRETADTLEQAAT